MVAQSALPPPEMIRQTAAEVVARPYYDLGGPPSSNAMPFWLEAFRWLIAPFRWLFDALNGLPDLVRWLIVVAAVVICVLLIAHIVYTVVTSIRGPIVRAKRASATPAMELGPEVLERDAATRGAQGDFIGAIRLLFQAALRRIELAEQRKLRPGFTNRQLLQRYHATPLFAPLEQLARMIDLKWYGNEPCGSADFAACQREHARILHYVAANTVAEKHVAESRRAVGA